LKTALTWITLSKSWLVSTLTCATRINYQQKSQWNQALNNYEYLPIFVASITFTTLRVGASPAGSIAAMDAAVIDDYLD
jgi:hypothetical protein